MDLRQAIRESLHTLKNEYGILSIKAEFEAEGSRKDELIMLREMVEREGLGLIIKIGGCEASHDIDQCKLLSATGIMAPMIETAFAAEKFKNAVARQYEDYTNIERIINAETITCFENFTEILDRVEGFLTGITVGRTDLTNSMGLDIKEVESDAVLSITKQFCIMAKERGITTNFGGNMSVQSIPFITEMNPYIDRFETRKVILAKNENTAVLQKAIQEALAFELLYLRFKSEYYMRMAQEDAQRIKRLENELE